MDQARAESFDLANGEGPVMTQLLPCPFCGRDCYLDTTPHGNETAHHVVCRVCACEGPWSKVEAGAIKTWNMRSDAALVQAQATLRNIQTTIGGYDANLADHDLEIAVATLVERAEDSDNIREELLRAQAEVERLRAENEALISKMEKLLQHAESMMDVWDKFKAGFPIFPIE